MATTIQVSNELAQELRSMKMFEKETYEELIWDLIEDRKVLSEETLKEIELARKQIAEGKSYTHEQVKKELGF